MVRKYQLIKNKFLIVLIAIFILIGTRFIFCYRIIPFPNYGNLKYKVGEVIYFPHFSFINPFKKQDIFNKITNYFESDKFLKEQKTTEVNYFKEMALRNRLQILSMKNTSNVYLILVTSIENSDAEMVFILDQKSDKIIGHK